MLDAAVGGGEDLQLALRAVDRLVIAGAGVFQGDLPVVLAVRDQDGTVIFSTTPTSDTRSAMAINSSRVSRRRH
ncbi:hypothetical protein ACFO8M_08955 [Glycomyces rhizosphaerae]|uniref:Uncharacterized protein n=1 Tax=Glycomyces rhizosphaerae TaxID=2054422 RepID=A0ABV7PVL7_9ACTN